MIRRVASALAPGLAASIAAASPVSAQTAAPAVRLTEPQAVPLDVTAPSTPPAPAGAASALLAQASYWQAQNRPDLALNAFERVLAAAPDNTAALAGAAQAQAALGNRAASEALLARLRRVAGPTNTRVVSDAEARVRGETVDREAIAEARRLAQSGHNAEAVIRYREA